MSDEIFEVATHSVDVAALGQDYSDRVDGERILLALPRPLSIGDEVRFVVILLDGTPAFAGAGRCIRPQVRFRGSHDGRDEVIPQDQTHALSGAGAPDVRKRAAKNPLNEGKPAGTTRSV